NLHFTKGYAKSLNLRTHFQFQESRADSTNDQKHLSRACVVLSTTNLFTLHRLPISCFVPHFSLSFDIYGFFFPSNLRISLFQLEFLNLPTLYICK
ncbi:unnamed protein product, partial [Arabidopsis halleri]